MPDNAPPHDPTAPVDPIDPADPTAPVDLTDPHVPSALVAAVVRYDDAPDECTVYPRDASDVELLTTWITAPEGAFVALDEMR